MTESEVGATIDYSRAISCLENALDVVSTNLPYSVLGNNPGQAELRAECCISYRQAIDCLKGIPWGGPERPVAGLGAGA